MKRLPNRALSNVDIMNHSKQIPYFRGVFMRDKLPIYPSPLECGILNLDSSKNPGSHWVAYAKYYDYIEYFDSYGNLKPPIEFVNYVGSNIHYNIENIQKDHPYNCGHLCLKFLKKFWSNKNLESY